MEVESLIRGRYHPFDEQIGFCTVHADLVTKDELRERKNLLVENVRWKPSMPNRKGRYLEEIEIMIRDYPNIGIAYDIAHAYINEEPIEEIIKYKDRIKLFHLTDTIGKEDRHMPLGKGEIDWNKFFKILGEINFRGFLIIEK